MSNQEKQIASISISGEIVLNMHSLNNEGGEGNQIMTRQLTIVDKEGIEHNVNGISGDMFKHIHTKHLINQAKTNSIPLCTNCKVADPNRLSSGSDLKELAKKPDKEITDKIIESCIIDDIHGVLVTSIGTEKKNLARKSSIEFGWTIGVPDKNNTETYIHLKLVPDSAGKKGEKSNEGQNIFHKPANHGVYAFVCSIDAYRIGLNELSRKYSIVDVERQIRYTAVIKALLHSILNPAGAMTSSQKPHITSFKGVVTYSECLCPAPNFGALNNNYREEVKEIVNNLNILEDGNINYQFFDSLSDFSGILKDLIYFKPFKLV